MYTELFRRNLKQSRISIHFLCDLVLFCVMSLLRLSNADVLRPKVWLLTWSFSFFMFKVLSKEDRSFGCGGWQISSKQSYKVGHTGREASPRPLLNMIFIALVMIFIGRLLTPFLSTITRKYFVGHPRQKWQKIIRSHFSGRNLERCVTINFSFLSCPIR